MRATPTRPLATLDLTRQSERDICELVRHMHSGRWPTWRLLIIRRAGDALIELAEWRRGGYVVLEWSLSEIKVTWKDQPSLAEAKRAFKARCAGPFSGPPALASHETARIPSALH